MYGLSPTYRLYECTNNEWVFLALVTNQEKEEFSRILSSIGIDALAIDQTIDNEKLIKSLETLFITRPALAWEKLFAPEGIGCVRADGLAPSQFWLDDEQIQSLELSKITNYPNWGDYQRHGPNVLFICGVEHLGPASTGGQHSEEILAELGFPQDQIHEFIGNDIIWKE